MADERLRTHFVRLLNEGRKEWHLLMALANLALNHRMSARHGTVVGPPGHLRRMTGPQDLTREERADDPQPSVAEIAETFDRFLAVVAVSVATTWGLQVNQATPDLPAIEACSGRGTAIGTTMSSTSFSSRRADGFIVDRTTWCPHDRDIRHSRSARWRFARFELSSQSTGVVGGSMAGIADCGRPHSQKSFCFSVLKIIRKLWQARQPNCQLPALRRDDNARQSRAHVAGYAVPPSERRSSIPARTRQVFGCSLHGP